MNLILYYLWNNRTYRNCILVIFSFIFYAWGEPIWISLLLFSATLDYTMGLLIERHQGTVLAKVGLATSVSLNLGLLAIFKYSGFLYENINFLLGTTFEVPRFTLPIGISFYTFQTMSYTIDVYRGNAQAQRSYLNFLLFVSSYHQLVAGPIVRYTHIAHEIENRKFNIGDIYSGVSRFCLGLFKKVFIANTAGEFVDKYFSPENFDPSVLTTAEAWFAVIMFSIQIYFDFSGYSDMAIGLGRMFGFHYHENFKYPYVATSASDFWRRWHISLGSFFRDYLYIPLGGNKKNMYRNLFIVWFLTGAWHGASWNYILWGVYFGVFIALERLFLKKLFDRIPVFFSHVYLLFIVLVSWALFYFEDLRSLSQVLAIMFFNTPNIYLPIEFLQLLRENIFWFALAVFMCLPVYNVFKKPLKLSLTKPSYAYLWVVIFVMNMIALFISTAMLTGKSYNPFLYFRF
ncbi:MAG: MBOAT family protein [Cytophagaceae bacterium]|nr:MBOAT family protein [Cytophagaceae bacterium]MDW8457201.1 MBOAT family O-acyltransferase [Cytophagaceae bacterium]